MDEFFLKSLSPDAQKILALVQGDQFKINRSSISVKGLIDIENAINFHLKWFKTIDLKQVPPQKREFTIHKIQALLELSSVYNTLAPDNPTTSKVQQFVNNIPLSMLKKVESIEKTKKPTPQKKRQYHKMLFYGAELNRGRLDISSCLSLINACFIYSRTDYTQDHPLPYVAEINFSFGMSSLILPFFNLGTLLHQFWKKHCNDLENDYKTKQFDLLFHQKRITFIKNIFNLTINTTTFLIGILELFPMYFYFSAINIGLDFVFYCWDFYDKYSHYIIQRQQEFEALNGLIRLVPFDEYLKKNNQSRIDYLCEIYDELLDDESIKNKEDILFLITSMICSEQKNKNAENKLYLEMATFAFIITVLLIIQHTVFPPLDPELTFMMGLLVLYVYHGLKSLIMENPIHLNQEYLELKDTQDQSIYLKGGEISRDSTFGHSSSFDLELIGTVGMKLLLPVMGMVMLQFIAPQLAIPIFLTIALIIKMSEIYSKNPPVPETEPLPTK